MHACMHAYIHSFIHSFHSFITYIHIYIRSHLNLEYGIGKLAIFGIPIIELENGYLEYQLMSKNGYLEYS